MCAGSRRPQVSFSAALAVLAALPLSRGGDEYLHVESTVTKILEGQTRVLDHCYYEQGEYTPYLPGHWGNASATTFKECQRRCLRLLVCFYFTFFSDTGECRLAGRDAIFHARPADQAFSVAGPRICPKFPPGCTEMPGPGFPGETADESKLAWPSHRVPQNMECWPKDWSTNAYSQCRTFKVLESTFTGWPGKCRGFRMVLVPHLESCESYCKQKLTCAAYQIVQTDKPFGPKTCWHADATSGIDCYERKHDPDFAPLSAKRFMRGNVRVLMNLQGVEVVGLYNVFPETYFIHVTDAAKACRYQCYSNLLCQYWQYYLESGCWVEDPIHTNEVGVQSPATTSSWLVGSQKSRTVLDGEYIQHVCFEAGEPGRQVKSEWTLVGENNDCSEDILKNLGGTGGNLDACKKLTLADADCGNQMYADGWRCTCVKRGEVCEKRRGRSESSLYEHAMVKRESKIMQFAKKHGASVMKAHGYHKLDWIKTKEVGKIFEVTLTVEGLRFSAVGDTQKVILIARWVPLVASVLEIPSSSITDLQNNPGGMEIFHGASPNVTKVSFAIMTSTRHVMDADVADDLKNESFTQRFTNATATLAPKAISGGLKISNVAVIRRGGALSDHSAGGVVTDQPRRNGRAAQIYKALRDKNGGGLNLGAIVGLVLVGGFAVGAVLSCQTRMHSRSSGSFGQWLGAGGESSSSSSDSGEDDLKYQRRQGLPRPYVNSGGDPARQVGFQP